VGVVSLVSALVLLVDPFWGERLTRDAPLGPPTILGARFFGYSNPAFTVLATSVVLACGLLAGQVKVNRRPGPTAAGIAVVGLALVGMLGMPSLGADFGGAIAVAAAFVVLVAATLGLPLNWKTGAMALVVGGIAGTVVAGWDYARGPERWTHLGAFVDTVLQGGLGDILMRKGAMWLRLSLAPAVGLILVAFVLRWLHHRGVLKVYQTEARAVGLRLRPLAAGLAALWMVGSLINDSGLVVAVMGLCLAGPLLGVVGTGRVRAGRDGKG
jgi:hypothetical protein